MSASRGTVGLVITVVVAAGVVGAWFVQPYLPRMAITSTSDTRDLLALHRDVMRSMKERGLSLSGATKSVTGKRFEVDAKVDREIAGPITSVAIDGVLFTAGPSNDLDMRRWQKFMEANKGKVVHLIGQVEPNTIAAILFHVDPDTIAPDPWSPLMLAVTTFPQLGIESPTTSPKSLNAAGATKPALTGSPSSMSGTAPPTATSTTDGCDMTGRWDLHFTWSRGSCGSPPRDRRIFIKQSGDGTARSLDGEDVTVTRDADGTCQLDVSDGTEDSMRDFTFSEHDGIVSGHGQYSDVYNCKRGAAIVGKRSQITKKDLRMTETDKKTYADVFFQESKSRCRALPYLDLPTATERSWVLTIGADGGPKRLVVDGTDQIIADRCDADFINNSEHWPAFVNRSEEALVIRGKEPANAPSPTPTPPPPALPSEKPKGQEVTPPGIDVDACARTVTYPAAAEAAKIDGDVSLRVSIDEHGTVTNVVVTSGPGHGLDEAAADALKTRCHFTAAHDHDGKPVPYVIPNYTFSFDLPH